MAKSNSIDVSQLSTEIGSILSMYSNNVSEATEQWLKDTAQKTAKNVQKNASSAGFKGGKKYIKGWTYKKKDGKYVVYNKNAPGLAHLLENGHQIVVHGVATGKRTRAFKHIKPAEEEINQMINDLVKEIENIK